jgi:hypothetical protein
MQSCLSHNIVENLKLSRNQRELYASIKIHVEKNCEIEEVIVILLVFEIAH